MLIIGRTKVWAQVVSTPYTAIDHDGLSDGFATVETQAVNLHVHELAT